MDLKEENRWLENERTRLLQRERETLKKYCELKRKNYELQTVLLDTIGNLRVLLHSTLGWEQETRDPIIEITDYLSDEFERLTKKEG